MKLCVSNYCDGKLMCYDFVCDCGGVKYNSMVKKCNLSICKVDCLWWVKVVCEVNLGN